LSTGELEASAERALAAALRAGASAADVLVAQSESLFAAVRLGKREKIKHSVERRIGLRVFAGKRSASGSSADLSDQALASLAEETVAHARLAEEDPSNGLPAPTLLATDSPDLEIFDPKARAFPAAEAIGLAAAAEDAALSLDARLTNSEGAEFESENNFVFYATSDGFRGSYPSSRFTLSVVPVATAEGEMQRDWWYTSARRFCDLESPERVGRHAAERTLRRLGARQVSTCEVPVVFEPEVASSLLAHFAAAACGTALTRQASFLLGRLHETIAAAQVRIVDEGRRLRGLATRPFDAEGLPTRVNTLVEAGKLEAFLLDTYCARKLGSEPTASAFRSVATPPAPRPSNLYLEPGRASRQEIIRSVRRGLLVTELIGMGVNLVTGDYSRGAVGQWIEGGEIAFAVEQITVAGNLLHMMQAIEAIGDDPCLDRPIASPTIKIGRMTVAGS